MKQFCGKVAQNVLYRNQIFLMAGSILTFTITALSIFGSHWLIQHHTWKISKANDAKQLVSSHIEALSFSGLWSICCGESVCEGQCQMLGYMRSDFEHSTTSVSLQVISFLRKSCIFPLTTFVLEGVGTLYILLVQMKRFRDQKFNLVGGIFFVLSGLTNVLGIIIYISNNDKLSESQVSEAKYGWSFYFSGTSFLLSEALGVFIIKNQIYQEKLIAEKNVETVELAVTKIKDKQGEKCKVSQPDKENQNRVEQMEESGSVIFKTKASSKAGQKRSLTRMNAFGDSMKLTLPLLTEKPSSTSNSFGKQSSGESAISTRSTQSSTDQAKVFSGQIGCHDVDLDFYDIDLTQLDETDDRRKALDISDFKEKPITYSSSYRFIAKPS